MASQGYIIVREDIIIDACARARDARPVDLQATRAAITESVEAYVLETAQGGNDRNRDLWGTLGVNVAVLGRFCPDLRDECREAARALCVHFVASDRY